MTLLAPPAHNWIDAVCRRFSEATGWRLEYVQEPIALSDGDDDGGECRTGRQSVLCENGRSACGPVATGGPPVSPARFRAASEPPAATDAWSVDVHDGRRRAGVLRLTSPDTEPGGRSWDAMCSLAALIAELISRSITAAAELSSRTHEVSTLIEIGMALAGESNLFRALSQLLRGAVQLTDFYSSAFFLLDPASGRLNLRAWHRIDPDDVPFIQRTLTADPPDLDALARGRLWLTRSGEGSDEWLPPDAATAVCLAVQTVEGPLGTLWAYDRRRRLRRESDLQVLGSVAAQIAAVLERLVLRTESAAGHRLRQDVRLASEYQYQTGEGGALPPDLPFDVAVLCASRYELGGDLCEIVPLSPGRTLIAVGDASGDSVPAAMLMSAARGALRALCGRPQPDPARTDELMAELNRAVCDMTPAHQFMSLWLGVIDARAGTLTHTNAGHPCPVILREDGHEQLDSHGMLLGVLREAAYGRSTVELARDDVLVAFSDGVTEAMNADRHLFGTENVVRAARASQGRSAAAILTAVREAVEQHVARGVRPDDRTLVVLRGVSSC